MKLLGEVCTRTRGKKRELQEGCEGKGQIEIIYLEDIVIP